MLKHFSKVAILISFLTLAAAGTLWLYDNYFYTSQNYLYEQWYFLGATSAFIFFTFVEVMQLMTKNNEKKNLTLKLLTWTSLLLLVATVTLFFLDYKTKWCTVGMLSIFGTLFIIFIIKTTIDSKKPNTTTELRWAIEGPVTKELKVRKKVSASSTKTEAPVEQTIETPKAEEKLIKKQAAKIVKTKVKKENKEIKKVYKQEAKKVKQATHIKSNSIKPKNSKPEVIDIKETTVSASILKPETIIKALELSSIKQSRKDNKKEIKVQTKQLKVEYKKVTKINKAKSDNPFDNMTVAEIKMLLSQTNIKISSIEKQHRIIDKKIQKHIKK